MTHDPTRETLRQTAFRAGEHLLVASREGAPDLELAAATTLLPASIAWLRAEVDQASAEPGAGLGPREALRTLLVVLEELQRLLPAAMASLIDDAIADEGTGVPTEERARARWALLSRQLLRAEELASWPRGRRLSR